MSVSAGRTLRGQIPADKKKGGKSKGKGKAKGKGKSATSSAAGAGGEAGSTSSDLPRAQDALSALGAEVTGLLRGLVTALKVGNASGGECWRVCAHVSVDAVDLRVGTVAVDKGRVVEEM